MILTSMHMIYTCIRMYTYNIIYITISVHIYIYRERERNIAINHVLIITEITSLYKIQNISQRKSRLQAADFLRLSGGLLVSPDERKPEECFQGLFFVQVMSVDFLEVRFVQRNFCSLYIYIYCICIYIYICR